MQRDVFLVHGFEKRSARHHWLKQRKEARAWSARFGTPLGLGPIAAQVPGYARWQLESDEVTTRFHLLDWSDIVAARMSAPTHIVAKDGALALARALRGGFFRMVRRRDRWMWAIMLLGFAPLAIPIALAILGLVLLTPALLLAAIAAGITAWCLIAAGPRSPVRYVLDIAWGARRLALRDHAALEARIKQFEEKLASATGEVYLVGHSLGAAIATRIAQSAPQGRTTLITVGQSIPLVSLQAEASQLRRQLAEMPLPWIDISAGRDVLGFDGYDPSPGKATCHGAYLSRAFSKGHLQARRWRAYDTHLLYFDAVQEPAPWDWFAVLASRQHVLDRMQSAKPKSGKGERRLPF